MNIYIVIFGVVISFCIGVFLSGKRNDRPGKIKSLKFNVKKYTIHLHHWFLSSVIFISFVILKFYNDLIYGILIGLIFQGLTYKDFYKIVYLKKI